MGSRARRGLGVMLMASSLAVGLLAPGAALAIDELPAERTEAGENLRIAFWNGRQSEATPTSVTTSFPPEAACLVAAQLCSFPTGDNDPTSGSDPTGGAGVGLVNPDAEPAPGLGAFGNAFLDAIDAQYTTGIEEAQGNDPGAPAEPVPPNTLPASVAFGQEYYRSAIEFPLPAVPAGQVVDSFIVVFAQGNPTFNNSSPALRQAVLATLTCAQTNDTALGRCQQEEFEKVATKSCTEDSIGPCMREDSPLLIQACPIGENLLSGENDVDWEAGGPQNEATLPSINCIAGSQGQPFEEDGTTFWAFDLSSALRGWTDGTIPYNGLLMSPGAAENFAFGDAETTFNKQLTLGAAAQYVLTTSDEPAPFVFPDFGNSGGDTGGGFGGDFGGGSTTTTTTTTGGFVSPPQPSANSPISVPAPSTSVADPSTTDAPAIAPSQTTDVALDGEAAAIPVSSDWLMLWLLPLFLLGAYLLSTSLSEEVAIAASRSGAMTRLLERRAIQSAPDLIRR